MGVASEECWSDGGRTCRTVGKANVEVGMMDGPRATKRVGGFFSSANRKRAGSSRSGDDLDTSTPREGDGSHREKAWAMRDS